MLCDVKTLIVFNIIMILTMFIHVVKNIDHSRTGPITYIDAEAKLLYSRTLSYTLHTDLILYMQISYSTWYGMVKVYLT